MNEMTRRLLPAAAISSFGFFATAIWYQFSAPKARSRSNATPIAYLDSNPEDVQRKATDHLIWEEVKKGEVLFARDTIRASGLSGARIRMEESGSMIELEPDSVIVLEQSRGKISLNLVNGGLFVKNDAGKGAASGLEIKIGGTKLAANGKGLEMNIHRNKSGEASIAVTKGNVTAVSAGKSITVDQGKAGSIDAKGLATDKLLQALQPAANATLDIGRGDVPVAFRWSPVDAGLDVYLELGNSPDELHRVSGAVGGAAGSVEAQIPRGDHYWRLVAVKKGDPAVVKASVAYKLTTIAVQPPELVSPLSGVTLDLKEATLVQKLAWAGSGSFESYEIKIGRSADFSDAATIKASAEEDQVTTTLTTPGSYHWKVIGLAKSGRHVESVARSFTVAHAEVKPPAKPPVLTNPPEGAKLTLAEAQSMVLRWQAVADATSYTIKADPFGAAEAVSEETSTRPELPLHLKTVGRFKWSVQANFAGAKSPWSQTRSFQVTAAKITIREEPIPDGVGKPVFKIAWSKGSAGVVKFRVGFSSDPKLTTAKWQTFAVTTAELETPHFGDYYVKVEGDDATGAVLAESELRRVKVNPPAKLPPPEIIQTNKGSRLLADANGDLTINWKPVEHATGYVMTVKDASGAVVFDTKTDTTHVELKNMMPGKHTVFMASVNVKAEAGPMKAVKSFEVPAVSAIKPPSGINDIHIK